MSRTHAARRRNVAPWPARRASMREQAGPPSASPRFRGRRHGSCLHASRDRLHCCGSRKACNLGLAVGVVDEFAVPELEVEYPPESPVEGFVLQHQALDGVAIEQAARETGRREEGIPDELTAAPAHP